ncbi:hypothetical protein [Aliivibrio fischeri]|uniref:hypothetical protein n=1 Tax=Aliivibrio fischeri TaxID=668 RepID=UPI001060DCB0|nr:hypothetical protein [Aliivibrio fischeri]TDM54404.1 hypothetical protein VFFQA001_07490 [Aliivibrio fischeri]
MICIACEEEHEKLAKSHVISNLFRKRMTGFQDHNGSRKFEFKWVGRKDLPKQDLPKPNLMCTKCDSNLGSLVERYVSNLMMPKDIEDWQEWKKLPIKPTPLDEVFDTTLWVGTYDYPEKNKTILDRFALSTAWRALHDMEKEGRALSTNFLNSERGVKVNKLARDYIFKGVKAEDLRDASLYFMGPNSAKIMSGQETEMPFAWAELGEDNELLGIGVILGYWIILWPLFELSPDYFDKLNQLERLCFINWVGKVKSDLDLNWPAA